MNISSLVNAPVKLATNCWQTVCQNKKTIAKATAVVALAAILYSQRQSLYYMQDSLIEVAGSAKGMERTVEGGGMSIGSCPGTDMRCPHSYTPYKLEVNLSKSAPDVRRLLDQVEDLYNSATGYGTGIYSSYRFHATRDPVVKDSDTVKATFLICRSSFSNLLFAPWRG